MQGHVRSRGVERVVVCQAAGRSLTVADVCLCLVPISLFLSIMSLV
jgi:hypothetical protein